jgi:hypothetical protein
MKHATLNVLISATACLAAPGCALLTTNPGHPDSYGRSLVSASYYDPKEIWSTSCKSPPSAANRSGAWTPPPPAYLATDTPCGIWQARGYGYNLHLKYKAAAYKAQDVQNAIAVPLFGAAIATAGAAIAHTSTVVVAATGLGGTSLYAGYQYLHPDQDAATDQNADSQLLCVVDRSKPLIGESSVPLILEKAALEDAIVKLLSDAGPLMNESNPSAADKAAQDAVNAAKDAGNAELKLLTADIDLYNTFPSEIYHLVDQIDAAAKTSGKRTIDYNGILSSMQASATHQQATTDAKGSLQQAQTAASKIANAPGTQSANAKLVSQGAHVPPGGAPAAPPQPAAGSILAQVSGPPTNGAKGTADATKTAPGTNDKADTGTGKTGTNQTTVTRLATILNSNTIDDITKVTIIVNDALQNMPSPDFTVTNTNLLACIPDPTGAAPAASTNSQKSSE